MEKLLRNRKWLPALWTCLAAVILWVNYLGGQDIAFPYLFLIPVALAARFNGRLWGIIFAIVMPATRFGFHLVWDKPLPLQEAAFNAAIRATVLVIATILIDRVTRQAREIRVLKGLLPICAFCKKIRTEDQKWQQMESYIVKHSEANFTHTFCPECAKKYYGEFLTGQTDDSEASPK